MNTMVNAETTPSRIARRFPFHRIELLVVFAVAFAVRAGIVLHSRGGPSGDFGYDASVYYTSASALIHGRLPYADFLLLHPPALTLALVPFAALGSVTTDHAGFITGNYVFQVLGGLNAVLVVLIARKVGLSRGAALVGGGFYALWLGSAGAELSMRLEPLSNAAFLVGLLLLLGADRESVSRRVFFLAGAAFGVAIVTKIWWVVPAVVVLAWSLSRRPRRASFVLLTGMATSGIVIAGPFFALAPAAMWRMVVLDQLGRARGRRSIVHRVVEITSLNKLLPAGGPRLAVLAVIVVLGLLAVAAAWQVRALRLVVLIAIAQLVVLLVSPTYFSYYSDYLAASVALVVAAAAAAVGRAVWARGVAVAAVAVVAVLAGIDVVQVGVLSNNTVRPFPGGRLAASVTHTHCVLADSPLALVELNVLSRDLARGCPNWGDVSGRTYDVDAPAVGHVPRPLNRAWQRDITRYLLSGDAEITIRSLTGLSPATRARLNRLPVIATAGGYTVHRVPSFERTHLTG